MNSELSVLFRSTDPSAPAQPSLLLAFPVEIRLGIYDLIISDFVQNHEPKLLAGGEGDLELQRSLHFHEDTHPLYALLFVNQLLRLEVSRTIYTTCSTLKFGSPSRCLFFLDWTKPQLHRLRSLRIAVPSQDSYSLEEVFDLLVKAKVPLEALAINFLYINSGSKRAPKDRTLSPSIGLEELDLARIQGNKISALFGQDLPAIPKPEYRTFPRVTNSAIEELGQCRGRSSLGQLTSIRYFETIYYPTGEWATECEMAILRLQAKMFETAAMEGKKVILRTPTSGMKAFVCVDVYKAKGQECRQETRSIENRNLWMDSKYGIEDTILEVDHDIPRMGVRSLEKFPRPRLGGYIIIGAACLIIAAPFALLYYLIYGILLVAGFIIKLPRQLWRRWH